MLTPPEAHRLIDRVVGKVRATKGADAIATLRSSREGNTRFAVNEISTSGAKTDASCEQSIAVLPFANQSGPDDEYFADGITDEVLNALAQIAGLRVAARTSCFAFKGRHEDLRLVGVRSSGVRLVRDGVRHVPRPGRWRGRVRARA